MSIAVSPSVIKNNVNLSLSSSVWEKEINLSMIVVTLLNIIQINTLTMNTILATNVQIGKYNLANRIVMAPLTRMRAKSDFTQNDLAAEYYGQRSSAGLIIAEATQISRQGQGNPQTPGIYTAEQVDAWKKITDEVHKNGGFIFL